jgi:hypothetical protein
MIEISFDKGKPESDGECIVVDGDKVIARFTGPDRDLNMMLFADIHNAWDALAWLVANPEWRLDSMKGSMKLTASTGEWASGSAYTNAIVPLIGKLAESVRDQIAKGKEVQ